MNDSVAVSQEQSLGGISVATRSLCPLCGNKGTHFYHGLFDWLFGVGGAWGMRRCLACDMAWLDPLPALSEIPKLYSRYYTHTANKPLTRLGRIRKATEQWEWIRLGYPVQPPGGVLARFLSRVPSIRRAAALEVLKLSGSETGSLLDVGCGNGDFLLRMRSFGWQVAGVDPDPTAVACARDRGLEVFQGTIADIPVIPGYDVITLNHVIEHVSDPVKLLQDCQRRLLPSGRLVIVTPNLNSLGHTWFKKFWRGLEVPRHLVVLSPQSLSECVQQSGLHLHSICTETRLARMIYIPSVYAQRGYLDVSNRTNLSTWIKIASYLFQALEDLLIGFKKTIGEEIFCVCGGSDGLFPPRETR